MKIQIDGGKRGMSVMTIVSLVVHAANANDAVVKQQC